MKTSKLINLSASNEANNVEKTNTFIELVNCREIFMALYRTGARTNSRLQSMKAIVDFGRSKGDCDTLPSGRNYLTPEEIVAIQELNLDESNPLRVVRDAFTLQCVYDSPRAVTDKNDLYAYCHCVGALLILAGIVKPMFTLNLGETNVPTSFYHTFCANPRLAKRTYAINSHKFAHVYSNLANS